MIYLDFALIANGKLSDEPICKTDDGRSKLFIEFFFCLIYLLFYLTVEIPINGKIRLGPNSCKGKTNSIIITITIHILFSLVCTCTITGFLCEDQCETIQASTSIGTVRDIDLLLKQICILY